MAEAHGEGSGRLADAVDSGREYVEERLKEADIPKSPKELADEYGCSNAHMQNVCSEMSAEGVIQRVKAGEYEGVDGPEEESDEGVTEGVAEGSQEGDASALDEDSKAEFDPSAVSDESEDVDESDESAVDVEAVDDVDDAREERAMPPGGALVVGTLLIVLFVFLGSSSAESSSEESSSEEAATGDGVSTIDDSSGLV